MTTINDDVDQFEHYRYRIEAKLIPKRGGEYETIELTQAISELRIVKHYDEQVMPYYRLTCAVSVEDATAIQAAWRTGHVYITMKKMKALRGGGGGEQREEAVGAEYIKDGEFRILVCDGAPPHVPEGQTHELAARVPSVKFVMELAPTIPLGINKTINNGAYHEITTAELAAHLVAENAPVENPNYSFVMAPTDNPKRYESIFMPPLNFVAALRHVDRVYGMYSGTMSVFMDVDRAYILSSTKATGAGKNDPLFVMLEVRPPEATSPNVIGSGSAYDGEGRAFRLRTGQRITARIDGPANREVEGENLKVVRATHDERSGSHCKSLTTDNNPPEGRQKEKVVWQKYDNPLTADRLRIQARENFTPALVTFDAIDLDLLRPNLQWTLLTDSGRAAPLEGQWRCRAAEILLKRAPGTEESAVVEVMVEILPAVSPDPKEQDAARPASAAAPVAAPSASAPATAAPADAPPVAAADPRAPVSVSPGLPAAAASSAAASSPTPAAVAAAATENLEEMRQAAIKSAEQTVAQKERLIGEAREQLDNVQKRLQTVPGPAMREQLREQRSYLMEDIKELEAEKKQAQETAARLRASAL